MPRTGRPIKGTEKKTKSLQLRLSQSTMDKLHKCSEIFKKSRTEIVEEGIDLVYEKVPK